MLTVEGTYRTVCCSTAKL